MRILVTGSRTWSDEEAIANELEGLFGIHGSPCCTVVHGASRYGVDAQVDRIARGYGLRVEPHPADWDKHGKSAGFLRNAAMAGLGASTCLAFIRCGSSGSNHMIQMAKANGIPVKVVERGPLVIISGTYHQARAWCDEHLVKWNGRDVHIITEGRGDRMRGLSNIETVFVGDWTRRRDFHEIHEFLTVARLTGGGSHR